MRHLPTRGETRRGRSRPRLRQRPLRRAGFAVAAVAAAFVVGGAAEYRDGSQTTPAWLVHGLGFSAPDAPLERRLARAVSVGLRPSGYTVSIRRAGTLTLARSGNAGPWS